MTIIIDANILISALINPAGKEAAIILDENDKVEFIAPDLIYTEVLSKKNKIIEGSHLTNSVFEKSLLLISDSITVFSVNKFHTDILKVAEELTYSIDKKDTQYVALTIFLEGLLWTGDLKLLRALKRKGFNQIITTPDFELILKGL
ncbi:MAG: PIN domain-containing protein [Ferruginibacter sp.]